MNISREEQRARLLRRIDLPDHNWKFSAADVNERERWDDYQLAFSETLSHTSTEWAPWYVIPADRKWFARFGAAAVLVHTLMELDPRFPRVTKQQRQALLEAKERLLEEQGTRSETPLTRLTPGDPARSRGLEFLESSLERGVEVLAIESLQQAVAQREVLEAAAHLRERQVGPGGVELVVELLEHLGGGDVDIGDGLALQDHPPGLALTHEFADLQPEGAGVGKEQWGLPAVHNDAWDLLCVWMTCRRRATLRHLRVCPGRRREATNCA